MSIHKWIRAGEGPDGTLFVAIKWDGKRLSITGVEGPRRNGDCKGSCGQCIDALDQLTSAEVDTAKLREIWKRWHLNYMRAGCEHQRALGWKSYDEHPSEPCPTCGYKYGTSWLHEDVPAEVIAYLESLPAADDCPWKLKL